MFANFLSMALKQPKAGHRSSGTPVLVINVTDIMNIVQTSYLQATSHISMLYGNPANTRH